MQKTQVPSLDQEDPLEKGMGLTCPLRKLNATQEETVKTRHGTTD